MRGQVARVVAELERRCIPADEAAGQPQSFYIGDEDDDANCFDLLVDGVNVAQADDGMVAGLPSGSPNPVCRHACRLHGTIATYQLPRARGMSAVEWRSTLLAAANDVAKEEELSTSTKTTFLRLVPIHLMVLQHWHDLVIPQRLCLVAWLLVVWHPTTS